jgi:hypothetical protein
MISNKASIAPPISNDRKNAQILFSVWKYIEDRKNIINRTSIEPKVPSSNPLPNRDTYLEEEKKDESKNTTGIAAPATISLSFGKENLPSPSLAINQKNRASVAPTEIRNPLLASSVTGT